MINLNLDDLKESEIEYTLLYEKRIPFIQIEDVVENEYVNVICSIRTTNELFVLGSLIHILKEKKCKYIKITFNYLFFINFNVTKNHFYNYCIKFINDLNVEEIQYYNFYNTVVSSNKIKLLNSTEFKLNLIFNNFILPLLDNNFIFATCPKDMIYVSKINEGKKAIMKYIPFKTDLKKVSFLENSLLKNNKEIVFLANESNFEDVLIAVKSYKKINFDKNVLITLILLDGYFSNIDNIFKNGTDKLIVTDFFYKNIEKKIEKYKEKTNIITNKKINEFFI